MERIIGKWLAVLMVFVMSGALFKVGTVQLITAAEEIRCVFDENSKIILLISS